MIVCIAIGFLTFNIISCSKKDQASKNDLVDTVWQCPDNTGPMNYRLIQFKADNKIEMHRSADAGTYARSYGIYDYSKPNVTMDFKTGDAFGIAFIGKATGTISGDNFTVIYNNKTYVFKKQYY